MEEGRRREARREQDNEACRGNGKAQILFFVRIQAVQHAPANHADLHAHVDDEGARGRGHGHVAKREAEHVGKESQGSGPGTLLPGIPPHRPLRVLTSKGLDDVEAAQGCQDEGCRQGAHARVEHGPHVAGNQGCTAEDGIAGKDGQAEYGEQGKVHEDVPANGSLAGGFPLQGLPGLEPVLTVQHAACGQGQVEHDAAACGQVEAAAMSCQHGDASLLMERDVGLQGRGINLPLLLDDGNLLGDILQLTDVAGPGIGGQHLACLVGQLDGRHVVVLGKVGSELAEEQVDVLLPFTQGRYLDGHGVQTVVEVFPEASVDNRLGQVDIGGCHDAYVGLLDL